MAAFIRRELLFGKVKSFFNCELTPKYVHKYFRKKDPEQLRKPGPTIISSKDKISARGYLRPQKAYDPPEDVEDQLTSIFVAVNVNSDPQFAISDPLLRFKILEECFRTFQHGVPNSLLHTINNIGDVVEFYKTPVDTATPIDRFQNMELPPNLHIQYDYHRFNPDTDTRFGGVSAFPKSGTIMSSLKAKKKYPDTKPQNWTKDWREQALGYIKWH